MKFYKNKGEWEKSVWRRRHGGGCLMDFTHFLANEEAEKEIFAEFCDAWGETHFIHKK